MPERIRYTEDKSVTHTAPSAQVTMKSEVPGGGAQSAQMPTAERLTWAGARQRNLRGGGSLSHSPEARRHEDGGREERERRKVRSYQSSGYILKATGSP